MENFRFFLKELAKNGSKNGGLKANTTSSDSKFCQLSKNTRLFYVDPVAVSEKNVFVSQGGVENQENWKKSQKLFFFVGHFQSLISTKIQV